MVCALSASRPYSGREHTVFILIQSGDVEDHGLFFRGGGCHGKRKGNGTENREPVVALTDPLFP